MGTEKKDLKDREGLRTYSHKYKKFVGKKWLVTYIDRTEDVPGEAPTISLNKGGYEGWSCSVDEAKELVAAITEVLK